MTEAEWLVCNSPNLMLDYLINVSRRKQLLFGCACCRSIWHLLTDERSRIAVKQTELYADHLISTNDLAFAWEAANDAKSILGARHAEQLNSLKQAIQTIWDIDSNDQALSQEIVNAIPVRAMLSWACSLVEIEPDQRASWLTLLGKSIEEFNGGQRALSQLEALRIKLESNEEETVIYAVQAYRNARSYSFAAAAASRLAWVAETEQEVVSLIKTAAKHATDATTLHSGSFYGEREQEAQCSLLRDIVGNPFQPSMIDHSQVERNEGLVLRTAQTIYENGHFDEVSRLGDLLEMAGCESEDILNHCSGKERHVRGCWVIDLILGKQ